MNTKYANHLNQAVLIRFSLREFAAYSFVLIGFLAALGIQKK